jgi:hypothetical protein
MSDETEKSSLLGIEDNRVVKKVAMLDIVTTT